MTRVTTAHLEARRKSILEAAHGVFARRGIKAATMAEIADDAGISPGAIYRYYDSKEALASACMRDGVELMTAEWHRIIEDAPDPLVAFYTIARGAFDELREEGAPDMTRLLLEEALTAARSDDPETVRSAREKREAVVIGLRDAIQRAIDAGQLPAAFDAYQLGHALCAFYTGVRVAKLVDPAVDSDAQLAQIWMMMNMARRAPTDGAAAS